MPELRLLRDKKGVSPMIAEIILIAIVFLIASAVIVVLGRTEVSGKSINVTLGVDGFVHGSNRLTITSLGKDVIPDAFLIDGESFEWKNLIVKKTGREVEPLDAHFNGRPVAALSHLIYEDMESRPQGTLKGNAVYDSSNKWVRLTEAQSNLNGELEYILSPPPASFVAEFQFWSGGGTGADAVWFYAYCTSTPTTEEEGAGGYHFVFDEYNEDNEIQLWYDGISIENASQSNLDDSNWHDAKVVFDGYAIEIYFDNELKLRYMDFDAPSRKNGTLFGWGARTGGLNNEHRIRSLKVRSIPFQPVGVDFSPGDILEFEFKDPLVVGDAITIHYVPEEKLLYMNDIS